MPSHRSVLIRTLYVVLADGKDTSMSQSVSSSCTVGDLLLRMNLGQGQTGCQYGVAGLMLQNETSPILVRREVSFVSGMTFRTW